MNRGLGIDNKIRQTVNGQAQYFVQDHLGSTNALTDATGNVVSSATYDSFGNATGNLATRYQYTGREKDADTGLYFYRNRWYDSNLGRFISEDPIGLNGGINQFGYVGGNPQNFVDPSGLAPRDWANWADDNLITPQYQTYQYIRENYLYGQDISISIGSSFTQITPEDAYNMAYSITDMFRVGEGTYCAFYAEDENIWGRAAFLTMDVQRAANLFTTLAAPFALRGVGAKPAPTNSNKFPTNPNDLLPNLSRDVKGRIFPSDKIRIRPEQHPMKSGETYSPRHHGQHYHVEYRLDATKSWNNKNNVIKSKPSGYVKGQGTGFLPGELFP